MSAQAAADRGRGYQNTQRVGHVEVLDLDLAAYLLMCNVPLAEATRQGREFRFTFLDQNNQIPSLAINYTNSESARFADCVRRIKKVVFAQPQPTR